MAKTQDAKKNVKKEHIHLILYVVYLFRVKIANLEAIQMKMDQLNAKNVEKVHFRTAVLPNV